jgi:hypothetical protein
LVSTVNNKSDILAERFYPEVLASTEDIVDREFNNNTGIELAISQLVTCNKVESILRNTKPDKYPGADEILNRFLRAIGKLLVKVLQALITAVIRVQYFLVQFREARTIIL